MSVLSVLALAGSVGLATAYPFNNLWPRAEVAKFPAGSSWDILLAGSAGISGVEGMGNDFSVIDIDLFDTSKETFADLKTTKTVICYFSAGSKEDWRPDAGDFVAGDLGNAVGGGPDGDWPGETWLDVTSANVKKVMKARIELAKSKGCDAVDPDNVDGFNNESGFSHPKSSYADYVKYMAQVAKDNGLAIGLKNSVDMIPDVVSSVDFAVNEQCHEYEGECAKYKPFTDQNKAVFNIEYGGNACESPAGVKLSTLIKSKDQGLNELGGACPSDGTNIPAVEKPSASSSPVASSSAASTTSIATPTATESTTPGEDEDGDEEDEDENEDEASTPTPSPTRRPWKGGHWRHTQE